MKRTKKQKMAAKLRHVNTQFIYNFDKPYTTGCKKNNTRISAEFSYLGSIKNNLIKSLTVAVLILISLVVVYWFS
jgi:hypothetical protein